MDPAASAFRYYHVKVAAKRLPGRSLRLDPLAIVFAGGAGAWREIGRTERRLNEWNPRFSTNVTLPADSDRQRREQLRVDFYNREQEESRFLGACEVPFYALIAAKGEAVELELATPGGGGMSRVFLTALEGAGIGGGEEAMCVSMQLMRTNYYGVGMRVYYEISRAGGGGYHPVFKSPHAQLDEQGWGQFPECKMSMREVTMDEEAVGLLISLYRYRRLGAKKLLGYFQTSVKELMRTREGDFVQFLPNTREDIIAADVQVLHARKVGVEYNFSFKLVNVQWKATYLTEENAN